MTAQQFCLSGHDDHSTVVNRMTQFIAGGGAPGGRRTSKFSEASVRGSELTVSGQAIIEEGDEEDEDIYDQFGLFDSDSSEEERKIRDPRATEIGQVWVMNDQGTY